jgi:type II secretory pathway component GspD/PulD (secretin)
LYFYGTRERYKTLLTILSEMDKPVKRVSYDLLIIQTQKSKVENWNSRLEFSRLTPGMSSNGFLSVAPNFSFNMNLVKAFGYSFAAELQASIQENETSIFADTTLYGVSDVPIEFRNTSTFRYRDPYINLETGNQIQSGITKEIVSGIVLEIVGSVSGNGTITTSVSASVSRRGADVSYNSGNPPPTSEKFVTTQVIGKSGEVIVLSGLVQNDSTYVEERVPFLGKIPVIGRLFSGKTKNNEKTEMIIYLVPHIEENVEISEPVDVENPTLLVNAILEVQEKISLDIRKSVIKTLSKF